MNSTRYQHQKKSWSRSKQAFFRNTEVRSSPPCLSNWTSRKEILPSTSSSVVNCMFGCWLLLTQLLLIVIPHRKDIVDISEPHFGSYDCCRQGLVFKLLHEQVGNYGGQWRTHRSTFYLLVVFVVDLEIRWAQTELHVLADDIRWDTCPVIQWFVF